MESEASPCMVSPSPPAVAGTKRIPKACSSCRRSKVKCDGERPCTRCDKLNKKCVFFEKPKDPVLERVTNLEMEVQHLRTQLEEVHRFLSRDCIHPSPIYNDQPVLNSNHGGMPSQLGQTSISSSQSMSQSLPWTTTGASESEDTRPVTKRRSGVGICIPEDSVSDFVTRGLITAEYAVLFFETFFQGCDRYIPIFDPEYDTFTSVRSRSSILFNAICTIGCRVATKAPNQATDILHADLKKSLNMIIQDKAMISLESVQALLIAASYSPERSLILSFATRIALDRHMDETLEKFMQYVPKKGAEGAHATNGMGAANEDERSLMREVRTWFGLLVLEHIFCVDGGKPPGLRLTEDARRCRILLSHPCTTVLDLRLFAQIELNILRANINDTLSTARNGSEVTNFVQRAKVDLDLWFDDWLRIIENSPSANEEKPYLLVALHVQKCWAELVLQCKALRTMGVENVAAMSPPSRAILQEAKTTAQKHLALITAKPNFYLAQLRYAMEFVWAKCAFCFLLLLKLSRLLPEPEQSEEHLDLLERGETILSELEDAGSRPGSNIYLRILRISIEKFGRTVRGNCVHHDGGLRDDDGDDSGGAAARDSSARPFWEVFDAQTDLQAFVPDEFVSEWDFPGLNLFYFPTAWQDFFGDFSLAV